MPTFRIYGWSMVALFAAMCSQLLSAAPFSKQYTIGLRDMSLDGDLRLACPLGRLPLKTKYSAEIWLEHKLEVLDYGEARSRFVLHPFETGVFRRDPGSWRWLRPGGGEMTFSVADEVEKSRAVAKPRLWNRIGATGKFRTYERNFVQLWTLASGCQVVCDEGWELCYRNGALDLILTPDDSELMVAASGKRIASISTGGQQIASIKWQTGNGPEHIMAGESVFNFNWNPEMFLSSVSGMNGVKYIFSYYKNGLLKSFSESGQRSVSFMWRQNEREAADVALPFILTGVGESEYVYTKSGGRIRIDITTPGSRPESLSATVRYGRVVSINQK